MGEPAGATALDDEDDAGVVVGYPHLEEAYRVGEGLIPVLRTAASSASSPPSPRDPRRSLPLFLFLTICG